MSNPSSALQTSDQQVAPERRPLFRFYPYSFQQRSVTGSQHLAFY